MLWMKLQEIDRNKKEESKLHVKLTFVFPFMVCSTYSDVYWLIVFYGAASKRD